MGGEAPAEPGFAVRGNNARPFTHHPSLVTDYVLRFAKMIQTRLPITLITSPDYVWIAESLNPTHVSTALWYFYGKNCDYLITYTITIYHYVDYLSRRSKIRKMKTENRKPRSLNYLTSQFHQVTPFSLFHCASNVRQTKRRRALNVRLTHRNKTEMAYQVMREIARMDAPMDP